MMVSLHSSNNRPKLMLSNKLLSYCLMVLVALPFSPTYGQAYDLELSKSTIAAGISSYGVPIPFNITISNTGLSDVTNVEVVDYVPAGYDFVSSDNPDWSFDILTGQATRTIVGPIEAGVDSLLTIFLRPVPVLNAADWVNAAEIAGARDINGSDINALDTDSNYDSTQGNMDALEDDYDEASVFVYDLALRKALSPSMTSYTYGDDIDFILTVFNQGSDTVRDVQVREFFAEGFVYNQSANAAAGWLDDEPIPYAILPDLIAPGDSASIVVRLELSQMMFDGRAWDNYATIDSAFTTAGVALIDDADSTPGTNSISENSVLPASSDDDNILGGGPSAGEDEDDHDVASIEIFDFALTKVREATVTPSFSYGQTVIFNNTVFNQGNQQGDSVIVVEYIPCGFRFVSFINPGWTYDDTSRKAYFNLVPAPMPGGDMVVPIVLVVEPCFDDPSTNWVNNAEIVAAVDTFGIRRDDIDSTPDDNQENDAGGNVNDGVTDNSLVGVGVVDEDDSDPATLEILDWALKLTIESPDTVRYGDIVRFKVTGYNQGNIEFASAEILVDLGVGYSYDALANPGWTASATEPHFTFTSPIAPGDSVEAFLDLTLLQTQNIDDQWVNYAQLVQLRDASGNRDDDADSFPSDTPAENSIKPGDPDDDNIFARGTNFMEDQDDHDPAGPDIFDLALSKRLVQSGRTLYDDLLEFVITIENQGNQAAQLINIVDYLPAGLGFNIDDQDEMWQYNAADSTASLTLSTMLAPDDQVEVSIFLTVECADATLDAWTNRAEISAAVNEDGLAAFDTDSDYDVDPDNDVGGTAGSAEDDNIDDSGNDADGDGVVDEDDSDPAFVPLVDLALKKVLTTATPYAIGDLLSFDIWVYNQGNIPLEDVTITDYIADGYGFSNIDNVGWTPVSTGATYTFDGLRLMPGDSTSIAIDLTIEVIQGGDLADYVNYTEVSAANDTLGVAVAGLDADSNPGSDMPSERAVMPGDNGDDDISSKALGGNEDDHDVAGFDPFGTVGDFVWKDLDYDGIQDPGEPGIGGVTITLQTCSGTTIATVESGPNGFYSFDQVLLGNYQLVFDLADVDGCIATLQGQGLSDAADSNIDETGTTDCFTINPDDFIDDVDAGFAGLADVGDFVWEDLDGDGIQDPNEPGIGGVLVTLFDQWGNPIASRTTDALGFFLFEDISVGRYYLAFDTGDPLLIATVSGAGNDAQKDSNVDGSNGAGTSPMFDLTPNNNDNSVDAGYYRCVTICGKTWLDLDGDHIRDVTENGINSMPINLYRLGADGQYQLFTTVETGFEPGTPSGDGYFEACVRPGTYYVEVPEIPQGMVMSDVVNTSNPYINSDVADFNGPSTTASFNLMSGDSKCDIGAGFAFVACIKGRVWIDASADGLRAPSEVLVEGVLVKIYTDQGELVGSAYTDVDGEYAFENLSPDSYYLTFYPDPSFGFTQPLALQGSTSTDSDVDHTYGLGSTRAISLAPGQCMLDIDAGLTQAVLPVVWDDISVQSLDRRHVLRWSTAREFNTLSYEIQRSLNGDTWDALGEIDAKNAAGGADYEWIDRDVDNTGLYTYRLEQFDFDGSSVYSPSVQILVEVQEDIILYPNPATGSTVLSLPAGSEARLYVTSQNGATIYEQIIRLDNAAATLYDIDVSTWPAGTYQVTTIIGNQHRSLPLLVIR